jgi:hypothetical protein
MVMATLSRGQRLGVGLGAIALVLIVGYLVLRLIHLRWGATAEEVARSMPGDLTRPGSTRAITIDAPPAAIWPWLAQWGQGRGGWYSYDWLENLLGFDIHSADRILPEHQQPQVGDPICMARNVCTSKVFIVEPEQFFGWQSFADDGTPVWTFILGLYPLNATQTRLIIRESFSETAMPAAALTVLEIPDSVMGLKALHTVKARAEGVNAKPLVTALEILFWLGALLPGVIAGVLVLTRSAWQAPLALGLLSVLVLLVLTFLYPPLWLRAASVAGVVSGLVWIWQRTGNL